jgi:hypothetical protein
MSSGIGEALLDKNAVFHAAVRLKRNVFNGADRVEVDIVDIGRPG